MTDQRLTDVLNRAQHLGFLGNGPVAEQIAHARAHAEAAGLQAVPSGSRVLDLGSGGGLPGLVIASFYPELRTTLLDRSTRRCDFLRGAVEALNLGASVTVAEADAADLAHSAEHRGAYHVVVSRLFGRTGAAAECAAGFLAGGGQVVVSEPPAPAPGRWPERGLAELGLQLMNMRAGPPNFAVLGLVGAVPARFPRPWKQQVKHPLF